MKARSARGARFDFRRFHDAVLLSGALPLTMIETKLNALVRVEQRRG